MENVNVTVLNSVGFIICKVNIKNEHDIKRSPFEIFGNNSDRLDTKVIYKGIYEYSDVAHKLNNNWYDYSTKLSPLTSKTLNLTLEVPQEVQNSDDVIIEFADYENKLNSYYIKIK